MLEKDSEGIKISEAEAQLYDRQIRLWGLDAQKRLRAARVLVCGLRGLGCEVAKNLVLAGVKSIKMMDQGMLTIEDVGANFLAPREKIGTNRAEACLDRLQQLNPMVEVTADTSNIGDKDGEFYKDFDIVLVTSYPKEMLIKINELCHEQGVKFYSGDVFGFFGYSFIDLVEHEYVEEVKVQPSSDKSDEPEAKKAKVDGKKTEAEPETKMVKNSMKFSKLSDAFNVDWASKNLESRVKRMDSSFFLLHVLFEFYSQKGRAPEAKTMQEDVTSLRELSQTITKKFSLPETKIPESILSLVFSELSPVSAIVGGVLAQEIIKAISNKDSPHNNFFLFNPLDSSGIVETINGV